MSKIIGNTTATPVPRSDWAQTDANKADFIVNKPDIRSLAFKDLVDKSDLSADVQESLNKADAAVSNLDGYATEAYVDKAISEKADVEHFHDDRYYTEQEIDAMVNGLATKDYVNTTVATNYDESIIGLSIDGQVITYIKGDGSVHTIVTQDTDTTYSLATDEVTGLTKLYATTGNAEDGTMTQRAIKTELDKKVGVSMDTASATLIFTI